MQFNSIDFLFIFFPLFMAVYLIVPQFLRSSVMILGSLVFYFLSASGNLWVVGLLVAFTLLTYIGGLTLKGPKRSGLLELYLVLMAGTLIFFKLYDGGRHLPAGMSFYMFQMAAYLIDTYRNKYEPVKNVLSFGAQMMFFPKLLSGPLMNPRQLQLEEQYSKPSSQHIHDGLQMLILGLGMKVLIANRLGGLWSQPAVMGYESISMPAAWLALIAYAMRLYFDFYGYSLMAKGLAKMLGYEIPHNFLHPYISKSVSEFYRRWHVTLGEWFREYVYIPLGGSRCSLLRNILNLAVVWLFTGLWHGVGGNYLLWAGFLLLFIILERVFFGKLLKKSAVISHIYLVFVILLSWIPFAIGDWNQMWIFVGRLFGQGGPALNPNDFIIWGRDYVAIVIAGVQLATPLPEKLWKKIRNSTFADIILFALFWVVVYYIATAAQDPFLYFAY